MILLERGVGFYFRCLQIKNLSKFNLSKQICFKISETKEFRTIIDFKFFSMQTNHGSIQTKGCFYSRWHGEIDSNIS